MLRTTQQLCLILNTYGIHAVSCSPWLTSKTKTERPVCTSIS